MMPFKRTIIFVALCAMLLVGCLAVAPVVQADPSVMPDMMGSEPSNGDISNLDGDGDFTPENCGIAGFFGTLTCDTSMFLSKIADASFNMLAMFMHIPPFTTTQSVSNPDATITYTVWSLFRGIANAIFVLVLLLVIYSYSTGVGLSTYNVKRMLPRLIVGIILVNLSFYISSLAVDLSNVLGRSIVQAMKWTTDVAISDTAVPQAASIFQQIAGSTLFVGAGVVGTALTLKYATMSFFLPILVSAVVGIVSTVVILLLRQVLSIVFVIISPLAFAAMMLPGTNSYFDKWKKVFTSVLIVYPAVSLLYGAGYMAGMVISFVASEGDSAIASAPGNILLQITGVGVQVLPLFMIPAVMKIGGGLLNRIGGITNTPGAKANKWAQGRAEVMNKQRSLKTLDAEKSGEASGYRGIRKMRHNTRMASMKREAKSQQIQEARGAAAGALIRNKMQEDSWSGRRLQSQIAGSNASKDIRRAKNAVLNQKVKANAKAVRAAVSQLNQEHVSRADRLQMAMASEQDRENGVVTELMQEAAIISLAEVGDVGAILDIIKSSSNLTVQQRQTLIQIIRKTGVMKSVPFLANPQAQEAILQGQVSDEASFQSQVVAPSLQNDDYTAASYATMDQDAARSIHDTINNGHVSDTVKQTHQAAAKQSLGAEETARKVAKGRKWIEHIANGTKGD